MQFLEDQLLKLVGDLALLGVYAGLSEQVPGIDFGLLQQQPKAGVLRGQEFLGRRRGRPSIGLDDDFQTSLDSITICRVPLISLGEVVFR